MNSALLKKKRHSLKICLKKFLEKIGSQDKQKVYRSDFTKFIS